MFVSWFKWDTRDCLDEYENEIQEEEAFMVNEVVLFCVNSIYLWLTLTVAFCSLRDAVNSALTWLLLTAPSALNSMKVSSCLLPPAAALRTDQAVKRNVQSSRKVSFTPFIDLSKCSQLLPNVHMIYYPCLRENEKKERLILCVSRYIEYPEYDNIQGTLRNVIFTWHWENNHQIIEANCKMPFCEDTCKAFHMEVKALWCLHWELYKYM